jgi:hypothetical protein
MTKLSQQAIAVAVVSVLPVLASAYRVRAVDALVLSLTGMLAVYNVNCLTKGNCNAWATLVALSFFVTTLSQFWNREGLATWNAWQKKDGTPDFTKLDGQIVVPSDFFVPSHFEDMVNDLKERLKNIKLWFLEIPLLCDIKKIIKDILESINEIFSITFWVKFIMSLAEMPMPCSGSKYFEKNYTEPEWISEIEANIMRRSGKFKHIVDGMVKQKVWEDNVTRLDFDTMTYRDFKHLGGVPILIFGDWDFTSAPRNSEWETSSSIVPVAARKAAYKMKHYGIGPIYYTTTYFGIFNASPPKYEYKKNGKAPPWQTPDDWNLPPAEPEPSDLLVNNNKYIVNLPTPPNISNITKNMTWDSIISDNPMTYSILPATDDTPTG